MDTQKLHDLIDKVIGKEGTLRTPSYWMRRVLNDVVGAVDGNATDISKLEAKIGSLEVSLAETHKKADYADKWIDSFVNYLTFVAEEDGLEIVLESFQYSGKLEYKIDDGQWASIGILEATPSVAKGQRVSFRGNLPVNSQEGIGKFTLSAKCSVEGTPMSLLYFDKKNYNRLPNYAFKDLFKNQVNLTSVSKDFLPATELADGCYSTMFYGCTSLVNTPELPARELTDSCYEQMFRGCTSLVTAPRLPATVLATDCYANMFSNCISLENAPELPATTLAERCYENMFCTCTNLSYIKAMFTTNPGSLYTTNWVIGVAPTGTFVKNAEATWDVNGINGIPEGWTVETAAA